MGHHLSCQVGYESLTGSKVVADQAVDTVGLDNHSFGCTFAVGTSGQAPVGYTADCMANLLN